VDAAHDDVGDSAKPTDVVGVGDTVQGQGLRLDGPVPAAGIEIGVEAGQPEGLAGCGEHAGAHGDQLLDATAGGGGVIEDLGGEAAGPERGGGLLQGRRGCGVGEGRGGNRGADGRTAAADQCHLPAAGLAG
jgi:hypothetical protein